MRGRRTRIAQVAAGLASCALVGLAGIVLPMGSSLAARGSQAVFQKKAAGGQQALPATPSPVPDGPESLPPVLASSPENKIAAPATEQALVAAPDPEKDADDFVARTRKEAADRIAALDKEANDLRIRLAKVEAASTKLKAAFGAVGDPVLQPAVPGAGRPDEPPLAKDSLDPPPAQHKRGTLPDRGPIPDEALPRERPKS